MDDINERVATKGWAVPNPNGTVDHLTTPDPDPVVFGDSLDVEKPNGKPPSEHEHEQELFATYCEDRAGRNAATRATILNEESTIAEYDAGRSRRKEGIKAEIRTKMLVMRQWA